MTSVNQSPVKFGITYHIQLPQGKLPEVKKAFDEKTSDSILWTLPNDGDVLSLGFEESKTQNTTRVRLAENQSMLTVVTNFKPDEKSDDVGELEKVFSGLGLTDVLNAVLDVFPWSNTDSEVTISLEDVLTESFSAGVDAQQQQPKKISQVAAHYDQVNKLMPGGETRLTEAVKANDFEKVVILLAHDSLDVNAYNSSGETALREAVIANNEKMVELLLNHPDIDVNKGNRDHNSTPLLKASARGWTEIMKLLLARPEIKIHQKNNNPKKYNTPYKYAKFNGHSEAAQLLEAYGANPEKMRWNAPRKLGRAFHKAVDNGKETEAIRIINHPDFEPNYAVDDRTCFYRACMKGRTSLVERMLATTLPDINTQRRLGFTPISIASEHGRAEVVKLLLKQPGIEPSLRNNYGDTAIMLAKRNGHEFIARLIQDFIDQQK